MTQPPAVPRNRVSMRLPAVLVHGPQEQKGVEGQPVGVVGAAYVHKEKAEGQNRAHPQGKPHLKAVRPHLVQQLPQRPLVPWHGPGSPCLLPLSLVKFPEDDEEGLEKILNRDMDLVLPCPCFQKQCLSRLLQRRSRRLFPEGCGCCPLQIDGCLFHQFGGSLLLQHGRGVSAAHKVGGPLEQEGETCRISSPPGWPPPFRPAWRRSPGTGAAAAHRDPQGSPGISPLPGAAGAGNLPGQTDPPALFCSSFPGDTGTGTASPTGKSRPGNTAWPLSAQKIPPGPLAGAAER